MDIRRFFGGVPKTDNSSNNGKTSHRQAAASKNKAANAKLIDKQGTTNRLKLNKTDVNGISSAKSKMTTDTLELEDEEEPIVTTIQQHHKKLKTGRDNKKLEHISSDRGVTAKKRERSSSHDSNVSRKVTRHRRLPKENDSEGDDESPIKIPKKVVKRKSLLSSDEELSERKSTSRKTPAKKTKNRIRTVSSSDSDSEEPLPKKVKGSKEPRNKSVVLVSDSDKDTPQKSSPLQAFMKPINKQSDKPPVIKKEIRQNLSVNAADFFGVDKVQQKEKTLVTESKYFKKSPATQQSLSASKSMVTDVIIDDDDDFTDAIQQLHSTELNKQIKSKRLTESDTKHNIDQSTSPPVDRLSKTPNETVTIVDSSSPLKDTCKPSLQPVRSSPRKYTPVKSAAAADTVTPTRTKQDQTGATEARKHNDTKIKNLDSTPSSDKKKAGPGYKAWLNREAPRNLGSKPIPEGAENCLEGLVFVVTGVLDSFDRDDVKSMIEKYGGKVTQSVSRKTSYMVVGRDAGESKTHKAEQLGVKCIDEDELLALIKERPGKKSQYLVAAERQAEQDKKDEAKRISNLARKQQERASANTTSSLTMPLSTVKHQSASSILPVSSHHAISAASPSSQPASQSHDSLLWVDKYKPTSMKRVIGQQGEKSIANKLVKWLSQWHKNRSLGKKSTGGMWGKDDGSGCKAALLSGPPGVGKTTTAQLVCQESGFTYVELNASDTRSKRTLKEVVAESLDNASLDTIFGSTLGSSAKSNKHCLIMDEVDGVAGTEDRGGIQELIDLIKHTKIPILCICNDRSHQKMRSLVNYCFDLRFYRPRIEQIKAAMMSILYKEKITMPPSALNELILAANHDVRQVIHNLYLWSAKDSAITYEEAKERARNIQKDTKIGPFDVCRKVFVDDEETRKMTLSDKSDLFFYDYSFGPLFVQENYISVIPRLPPGAGLTHHLSRLARTADALSDGDTVERCIRSRNNWSLLPIEAMFASVIPGEMMRGSMSNQITFPTWLGKNSARGKSDRQLSELLSHMSLKISTTKDGLNRDYLPYFRDFLTQPLIHNESEGIGSVINTLDSYDLVKDDLDVILDVTKWPNSSDPMSMLATKTKAALTRTYNKQVHLTPYSHQGATKKSRAVPSTSGDLLGDEEDTNAQSDNEEDTNLSAFITKPRTTKAASTASPKLSKTSTKGKGRGKNK